VKTISKALGIDDGSSAQAAAIAAQNKQAAMLRQQARDINRIEAGQRRLYKGGGAGLLAFVDDEELNGTFG
jgi:N-acetylmuramic acid 6-phosphate (MurNAc-6-P) etherase